MREPHRSGAAAAAAAASEPSCASRSLRRGAVETRARDLAAEAALGTEAVAELLRHLPNLGNPNEPSPPPPSVCKNLRLAKERKDVQGHFILSGSVVGVLGPALGRSSHELITLKWGHMNREARQLFSALCPSSARLESYIMHCFNYYLGFWVPPL